MKKSLYEDYITGQPKATGLFSRLPDAMFSEAWTNSMWASGMADAVNQTQAALGAAKEYAAGNELVIATGQQPGMFTGPLYTIYKAITAINLANRFRAAGVSCVPLFWVAGDDHDFDECRTAHFFTKRSDLLSLTYVPREVEVKDMPIYRLPLDAQVHKFIDTVAASCRGAGESVGSFCTVADQSDSLAHWFALIIARLFRARLFMSALGTCRTYRCTSRARARSRNRQYAIAETGKVRIVGLYPVNTTCSECVQFLLNRMDADVRLL